MAKHRIKQLNEDGAGQEFDITDGFTMGRSQQNSMVLNSPLISRTHARIEVTDGGVVLKDLDSGNGTFVDGRRIVEVKLENGQVFMIGNFELRFEEGSSDDEFALYTTSSDSGIKLKKGVEGDVKAAPAKEIMQTMFTPSSNTVSAERVKDLQLRLQAVYEANEIISTEHDLHKVFERIVEQIVRLVPASNAVIMLLDSESGKLRSKYEYSTSENADIQVSSTVIKRSFIDGEAVLVYDASADSRFGEAQSIVMGNIASVMCCPMTFNQQHLGILYLDTRGTANAFKESDMELLVGLAGPAAVAIKNAQYHDELESDFQTTLRLLSNAIEMRDHYTLGHTFRVTKYSVAIARELGWSEERLIEVEMGGVLHDVGKIAIPDAILGKADKLTDEEYAMMKIHPQRGADMMKDCKKLEPLIPYCLYHHEQFDGSGYPHGLVGDLIPIEGRVVAVGDTFDAITSNRPYRDGRSAEVGLDIILKCKGTQFDPECVDAFVRAFKKGRIEPFMQRTQDDDCEGVVCPFCSAFIVIPLDSAEDDLHKCNVCYRMVKLQAQHDMFFAVLATAAESELDRSSDSGIAVKDDSGISVRRKKVEKTKKPKKK